MFNDVSDNCVTDTILSRIILTVESITEKFERIKGELGETSGKYECVFDEMKQIKVDTEKIQVEINKGGEKVIELTHLFNEMKLRMDTLDESFKEITVHSNDKKKTKNKPKCNIQ